ncbi:transcriptional regulator with XRE-family HTH domain [Anoxybacillus calidus]|uniref:Transcriptional regulator with XRE-family HTH domain n=2 Tax=[Anoxybacillus] calidus TaxID=575178 RepID=A0A7V9YZF5_9BACL|nr:transcriptional regulator with XRE-family HTH domain [Anoxybacillus calidus]
MEKMKKLADNLKFLRKQRNWTQEELAQRLNISRSQITKWESGDQLPDLETLEKLSNLYEVSIDYLIGRQFYKKDLLREVNRIYRTNEIDEVMLDIIDYLKQNPEMEKTIHTLSKLPIKKRKHLETVIITMLTEFSRAID